MTQSDQPAFGSFPNPHKWLHGVPVEPYYSRPQIHRPQGCSAHHFMVSSPSPEGPPGHNEIVSFILFPSRQKALLYITLTMKILSKTIFLLFTGPVFLSVLLQRIILATTRKAQGDLCDYWGFCVTSSHL